MTQWIRGAVLGALACTTASSPLLAQQVDRARVKAVTDSAVDAALATGKAAGMAVAVVRGRDTLVFQGYGAADLEFDVPMPVDAVFEIGSVTKQFTAAAILQLADSGRLSLDDELTKFLPDYPLQGHRVTIRRLLDHTSGIASYTSLPAFRELSVLALPRDSLVALVGRQPFDFAPGERMSYNNSAYFLLGLIIEKVSGSSYADYVAQHLFAPAGMTSSRYCNEQAVTRHRAHGYDPGPDGLVRAAYLVHTWPYSAGSLCSTVGDLVAWNRALHGGRLLSARGYRELVTAGMLNDGTRLRYAKGVAVDSLLGRRTVHHGGDINGFASELEWFPDGEVTIAVLINSEGPVRPQAIARAIGLALFDQRPAKPMALRGRAGDYAGQYSDGTDSTATRIGISADSAGTGLLLQLGKRPTITLRFAGGDTFEAPDAPIGNVRMTFMRRGGRVSAVRFDPVFRNELLQRVDASH